MVESKNTAAVPEILTRVYGSLVWVMERISHTPFVRPVTIGIVPADGRRDRAAPIREESARHTYTACRRPRPAGRQPARVP